MAMRQMARSMAARVFAAGASRPSFSGTGSGASTRRFFCSKEELPKHPRYRYWDLPPRRESIWAEMTEWTLEEMFVVTFGAVVIPFSALVGIDFLCYLPECWRAGGFQSTDPSWDDED